MPGTNVEERWLRLQPIKIGWLGMEWSGFEREIRMRPTKASNAAYWTAATSSCSSRMRGSRRAPHRPGSSRTVAWSTLVASRSSGPIHRLCHGAGRDGQRPEGAACQHVRHRRLPR